MLGLLLFVVVGETTTVCRMSRIKGWVLRERKDGRVGMCREEEGAWENGRGGFLLKAQRRGGGGSAGRLTD